MRLSPRSLIVFYAALAAAAYLVARLPGDPDPAPSWIIVDALLVFFIARGSRVAWTLACVFDSFLVVIVVLGAATPVPGALVAIAVLKAAGVAVLLARPLRAHVGRVALT